MHLDINRNIKSELNIIGELSIDGKFFSYTLEDIERNKKVQNMTCIPKSADLPKESSYKVQVTYSPHFKRRLPLIFTNNKTLAIESEHGNYAGVRFHGGNTELDTDACVLVAKTKHINEHSGIFDNGKEVMNWIQGSLSNELCKLLDDGSVHTLTIK